MKKQNAKKEIHPKYSLLNESLKALKKGVINLLILKGDAGFGKSYSSEKYLKDKGVNYAHINSYTTPLEFYNLLYINRNREVIIIDDTQGIGDLKIIAILKGACWNVLDNNRKVSYHTTAKEFEKRKLPSSFNLGSKLIIIMNEDLPHFKPILDRGVCIEFKFSFEDKIRIFENIGEDAGISDSILEYVKENCNEANLNISIRTLITLSKLESSGFNWRNFAEEMLRLDNEAILLIDLLSNYQLSQVGQEWCKETGHGIATFWRKYSLLGGKKLRKRLREKAKANFNKLKGGIEETMAKKTKEVAEETADEDESDDEEVEDEDEE